MTINTEDLLNSILDSLDRVEHIDSEDIPNIDLYMDQVTTFMDHRLKNTTRNPAEDKILTKTMINNYAKNDLLPPPVKKKYSRDHIIMLIFIYYFKGILSINDIQALLGPLATRYFQGDGRLNLKHIYDEVFSMEDGHIQELKENIRHEYEKSRELFQDEEEKDRDFLQIFSFVSLLSYDVYVKKLLVEKLIDAYTQKETDKEAEKAAKAKQEKSKEKAEKSKAGGEQGKAEKPKAGGESGKAEKPKAGEESGKA